MSYWREVLGQAWVETRAAADLKNRRQLAFGALVVVAVTVIFYVLGGPLQAFDYARATAAVAFASIAVFFVFFLWHLLKAPRSWRAARPRCRRRPGANSKESSAA